MDFHTYALPEVKDLTQSLLEDFAQPMLKMVVTNVDNLEFRVGTCMKILLGFKDMQFVTTTCSDLIMGPIKDIESLIASCTDSEKLAAYNEELQFLTQCVDLDDVVTLNAVRTTDAR